MHPTNARTEKASEPRPIGYEPPKKSATSASPKVLELPQDLPLPAVLHLRYFTARRLTIRSASKLLSVIMSRYPAHFKAQNNSSSITGKAGINTPAMPRNGSCRSRNTRANPYPQPDLMTDYHVYEPRQGNGLPHAPSTPSWVRDQLGGFRAGARAGWGIWRPTASSKPSTTSHPSSASPASVAKTRCAISRRQAAVDSSTGKITKIVVTPSVGGGPVGQY